MQQLLTFIFYIILRVPLTPVCLGTYFLLLYLNLTDQSDVEIWKLFMLLLLPGWVEYCAAGWYAKVKKQ